MSGEESGHPVRAFLVRATGRSMSLIEIMIIVFIIAALAAGASPVYHGYTLDAKTTEAKMLAGSLWTAVTSRAVTGCGTTVPVAASYVKAGLDATGTTVPARWIVASGGSDPVAADCATGVITPAGDMFMISGVADDVSSIRVKLHHSATATPPSRLQCSVDAGISFMDC